MISTDIFQLPDFPANGASACPRRCQQALTASQQFQGRRGARILQNRIDRMLNASPIALIGCSIAAALAFGTPIYPGGLQTVMPMSEWQSLFDYFRTSSHDPRPQRLVDTVNAPVGQGWG
jgi:hypothetical protein